MKAEVLDTVNLAGVFTRLNIKVNVFTQLAVFACGIKGQEWFIENCGQQDVKAGG